MKGRLADDVSERIVAAAEGNPLFVEQMLAMLLEDGADPAPAVPPTIQALLAARLDRLDPSEQQVIERASIEGRHFHRERGRGARARLAARRCVATSAGAGAQGARPSRSVGSRRRRGVRVPAPADPGRSIRGRPEAVARGAARALRGPARGARRRAGGDRRLPPGAGLPLPGGAGAGRRGRPLARGTGGATPARSRVRRACARRLAGGARPARPRRGPAPGRRRAEARGTPLHGLGRARLGERRRRGALPRRGARARGRRASGEGPRQPAGAREPDRSGGHDGAGAGEARTSSSTSSSDSATKSA